MGERTHTTVETRELLDPMARIKHMDELGTEVQVLYPTMFLVNAIQGVQLEAALFRAYNSYMAEACARSHGRLRWAAPVPFRDPRAAVQEIQRVSDLGAAGIFTLGTVASDFMIASVFLLSPSNQTVTAGLGTFDVALDELAAVAGVNLLAIPVVAISAVFARGFVRGLTAAMVEGA